MLVLQNNPTKLLLWSPFSSLMGLFGLFFTIAGICALDDISHQASLRCLASTGCTHAERYTFHTQPTWTSDRSSLESAGVEVVVGGRRNLCRLSLRTGQGEHVLLPKSKCAVVRDFATQIDSFIGKGTEVDLQLISHDDNQAAILVAAMSLIPGLLFVLLGRVRTAVFDRTKKTVVIRSIGFRGVSSTSLALDQIQEVSIAQRMTDKKGKPLFHVLLLTQSRGACALDDEATLSSAGATQQADVIRGFLGLVRLASSRCSTRRQDPAGEYRANSAGQKGVAKSSRFSCDERFDVGISSPHVQGPAHRSVVHVAVATVVDSAGDAGL